MRSRIGLNRASAPLPALRKGATFYESDFVGASKELGPQLSYKYSGRLKLDLIETIALQLSTNCF
jgi:hypothetical protein